VEAGSAAGAGAALAKNIPFSFEPAQKEMGLAAFAEQHNQTTG
jgi:hypothetical protein